MVPDFRYAVGNGHGDELFAPHKSVIRYPCDGQAVIHGGNDGFGNILLSGFDLVSGRTVLQSKTAESEAFIVPSVNDDGFFESVCVNLDIVALGKPNLLDRAAPESVKFYFFKVGSVV